MSDSPAGTDLADDGKNDVFGRDPIAKFAIDCDPHGFRPLPPDRLGRHDMSGFRGTNAKPEGTQGAMG